MPGAPGKLEPKMGPEMGGPGLGESVHTSAEGQALEWFLMGLVGTCAAPWRGSLFCCGREKKFEHGLARVFFNLPDKKKIHMEPFLEKLREGGQS